MFFTAWPCLAAWLSHRGGRGSIGPAGFLLVVGMVVAGQPGERLETRGPRQLPDRLGPSCGQAQPEPASAADDAPEATEPTIELRLGVWVRPSLGQRQVGAAETAGLSGVGDRHCAAWRPP
jgi:hypothetical protein